MRRIVATPSRRLSSVSRCASVLATSALIRARPTRPGNLEVAGTFFFGDPGSIQLAVTGGTGRYRDAAGTFTVRNGGEGPRELFIIRLVD